MVADEYRRRAAECLRIAEGITDSQHRTTLIDMAQYWQRLARQAENAAPPGEPVIVAPTP
jgi:hypothetical protein